MVSMGFYCGANGVLKWSWRFYERFSRECTKLPAGGGSLSGAVLNGETSKRCVVYALAGSLIHLFTVTTDDDHVPSNGIGENRRGYVR